MWGTAFFPLKIALLLILVTAFTSTICGVYRETVCIVTTVTATTISKLIVFLILYLYDHDNINVVYVRQWLPFHASIILSNELAQGSKDKMR